MSIGTVSPEVPSRRLDDRRDVETDDRMNAAFATAAFPRSRNLLFHSVDGELPRMATHRHNLPADKDGFRHVTRIS
jgi:hypothetical protein